MHFSPKSCSILINVFDFKVTPLSSIIGSASNIPSLLIFQVPCGKESTGVITIESSSNPSIGLTPGFNFRLKNWLKDFQFELSSYHPLSNSKDFSLINILYISSFHELGPSKNSFHSLQ